MFRRFPSSGRLALVALCLFLLPSGVVASSASTLAGPLLNVSLEGSISRGSDTLPLSEQARPGDVLNWHMVISNRGDGPSPSVWSVDGEIDSKTVIVVGSAQGDGSPAVTFSIDGGRTFSARPMET